MSTAKAVHLCALAKAFWSIGCRVWIADATSCAVSSKPKSQKARVALLPRVRSLRLTMFQRRQHLLHLSLPQLSQRPS
jgi:hypothetical protein